MSRKSNVAPLSGTPIPGARQAVVALAALAWAGTAVAQAASAAGSSGNSAGQAAPETDVGQTGGTLSDKLNSTNGVIRPQTDVDPGMGRPAPATGTMPIIPPPGSPGGPAGVQPK